MIGQKGNFNLTAMFKYQYLNTQFEWQWENSQGKLLKS